MKSLTPSSLGDIVGFFVLTSSPFLLFYNTLLVHAHVVPEDEIGGLPPEVDVYAGNETVEGGPSYGLDTSYAVTSRKISDNYAWLPHNVDPQHNLTPRRYRGVPVQPMGDRQSAYNDLVAGCKKHYGLLKGTACSVTERDRIAMNQRQPSSMTNYTDLGFKKIRAPAHVFKIIREFWERNKDRQTEEAWFTGNTFTNYWDSPTYMVSVENARLRGGGGGLKKQIWDMSRNTLQQWTGEELTPCSLYGVRVYTEGAMLATHVDRMPLVSSAIVNVAQDVDEPWPLEVYAHDGRAYNVTMEPGDMILYESHSVLHGRPFPLKGRYYANIFIHFEPVGHTLRHHHKMGTDPDAEEDLREKSHAGHENAAKLPSYIKEGSEEATRWRSEHGKEDWKPEESPSFTTGSTDAHEAASSGKMDTLEQIAKNEKHKLTTKDTNGWEPIHEGARGGHKDVLELLIAHGANINERTGHGKGGSPLYLATQAHGKLHASVKFLEEMGAKYIEPEL